MALVLIKRYISIGISNITKNTKGNFAKATKNGGSWWIINFVMSCKLAKLTVGPLRISFCKPSHIIIKQIHSENKDSYLSEYNQLFMYQLIFKLLLNFSLYYTGI